MVCTVFLHEFTWANFPYFNPLPHRLYLEITSLYESTEKELLLVKRKFSELYRFETIVANRALAPLEPMLYLPQ